MDSLYVHHMFIMESLYIHNMFIKDSPNVHYMPTMDLTCLEINKATEHIP